MIILNKPNKSMFPIAQPNQGTSIIGILRIIGLVTEIAGTFIASIFSSGATLPIAISLAGTAFQIGLDSYQFARGQIGSREFTLSTLINILSFGLPTLITPALNRIRTGAIQIRGYKYNKYVLRGSETFKESLAKARLNPDKFTRLSIYETRKLFRTTNIPNKFIFGGTAYENAFNKAFGNFSKYSNKDRAVLHSLVKKLARPTSNVKKVSIESGYWTKLSISAKRDLVRWAEKIKPAINDVVKVNGQAVKKTIEQLNNIIGKVPGLNLEKIAPYRSLIDSVDSSLLNLATILQKQLDKPVLTKFLLWFGSRGQKKLWNSKNIRDLSPKTYGGYRLTQLTQRLDPTNLARDVVKGIYYKLNKNLKIAGQSVKALARDKNITKRIAKFDEWAFRLSKTDNSNRLFWKNWPSSTNWIKRKFFYASDQLRKVGGHRFKSWSYVMGYQVVENQPKTQILRIFFNPVSTAGYSIGSKNLGGKKPLIVRLSKSQIEAWKIASSPGKFYNKGDTKWPPIATSPGGRKIDWANRLFNGLDDLLMFIPLNGLRNLLSTFSNLKNVGLSIVQGNFAQKFYSQFVPAFFRNLSSYGARAFGRLIGTKLKLGDVGKRMLERLSVGSIQLFEVRGNRTITLANGSKIKTGTFKFGNPNNFTKFGLQVVGGGTQAILKSKLKQKIYARGHVLTRKYQSQSKLRNYRRTHKILTSW